MHQHPSYGDDPERIVLWRRDHCQLMTIGHHFMIYLHHFSLGLRVPHVEHRQSQESPAGPSSKDHERPSAATQAAWPSRRSTSDFPPDENFGRPWQCGRQAAILGFCRQSQRGAPWDLADHEAFAPNGQGLLSGIGVAWRLVIRNSLARALSTAPLVSGRPPRNLPSTD